VIGSQGLSVSGFQESVLPVTQRPRRPLALDLRSRVENVLVMAADASRSAGRQPEDVTIVAVTKTVERAVIDEAYALGLRHFGENRVQDTRRKLTDLGPLPDETVLHLIGHLQSNKAKMAVALFDIIESVDRISLIDVLEKEAERCGQPVSVLLQVNIAREPQKAGCVPESASELMERLVRSPWLHPRGLMTIAPLVANPEETRPVFSSLRILRDALQRKHPTVDLGTLSMGMTDDFPVAIEEGATSVRIGRAIFEGLG
jgi:PLP dependent protein